METDLVKIFGSYTAKKLDETTWIIELMEGTQYIYLLEGAEKALLMDTGYGAGNLKAFVETLTKKPLMVVNTHFHPDHSGGNGEFECVYMSSGEVLDRHTVEDEGVLAFDRCKLPYPNYEKRYLEDGDVIDLGDREITVLKLKDAHCNSSLFFLDKGHRLLFVGDEYEVAQVLMFDNSRNPEAGYEVHERLNNYKENTEYLISLDSCYDTVLPCHNATPMEKAYLKEFSELVDALYAGTATIEDNLNHPFMEQQPMGPELCRVRWKRASIFIKKTDIVNL